MDCKHDWMIASIDANNVSTKVRQSQLI